MSASKKTPRRSIVPLKNLPGIEFNLPSSGSSSTADNDGGSPALVAGRTPVMTVNDDNAERQKRRQHRVHELNQQNASSPNRDKSKRLSLGGLTSNSNITGLSTTDLSSYYSKCIQMSSENKITAKNAFGLHLIDCMTEMLKNKDSTMDNFQVVGCTLDASAKIYGYRVDFVHTETQKIASGLSRSSPSANRSKRNLSNDDDDDAENSDENNLQKRKRKKVNRTSNIEKNPKNLNMNKLTDQSEMNPMFHKTTELFTDTGSGASVLLASLGCRNDNCALVLDSMDPLESVTNDKNAASNCTSTAACGDVDLAQFLAILESVVSGEQQICPEFADFEFNHFEPCDALETPWAINNTDRDVSIFLPDGNNEPQEGDIFDHDNAADSDADAPGDVAGPSMPVPRIVIDPPATDQREAAALMNMTAGLALEPDEYSYFKKDFASAWAGPNHWHLRPPPKAGVRTTTAKEPKPRAKKPPFRLLFLSTKDALKDLEYAFERTNTPKRLSKDARRKWSPENTTLVEDTHYKAVALRQLFLRPFVEVWGKLPIKNQTTDADLQNYNYENPNDVENFCPATAVDENSRHSVLSGNENVLSPAMSRCFRESHFDLETQMGGSQETQAAFTGDNLIQQPKKVATFRIPYLNAAKRVNVRHVKESIWKMLKSGVNSSDAMTCDDVASDRTLTPDGARKEQSFRHLYRSLPKVLSAENAANMTYAMAFLCTLHLANENNLELIPQKNMIDFKIYLPKGAYIS